jgi:hypothetical protein
MRATRQQRNSLDLRGGAFDTATVLRVFLRDRYNLENSSRSGDVTKEPLGALSSAVRAEDS